MAESAERIADWLPRARAGCREALGQLLDACRDYLLLVARREIDPNLHAKGGASDLVQETFLEAQRDFAQFHGGTEAELLAWLRRLLLNNLANFSRRYRDTDKRQIGREVSLQAGGPGSEPGCDPVAGNLSPSGEAAAHEQAEALRRTLERLPDDYQRVIRLHHEEQRPFEEIAALLGRSLSATRKLWARAVRRLRQELETPS
jgi:RNA polymerase sigma-70 factor (ECF subfamily)